MIEIHMMLKGLRAMGLAFGREITEELAEVYHAVLGHKLTVEQWRTAVRTSLERERFFPPPAALLAYGAPEQPVATLAATVHDEIEDHYARARYLSHLDVEAKWGPAAARAFSAAGGRPAFEWCEPESRPFRLKRFVEAWEEQAKADPATKQLTSRSEAVTLLDGVREASGETRGFGITVEKFKAMIAAQGPIPPGAAEDFEARVQYLRRQAVEIVGSDE